MKSQSALRWLARHACPEPACRTGRRGRRVGLAWAVAAGLASPSAAMPQSTRRQEKQETASAPAALRSAAAGSGQAAGQRAEKTGVLPTRRGLRLRLVAPLGNVRILTRDSEPAEVRYRIWVEGETEKDVGQFVVSARSTPEGISINAAMPGDNQWRGRTPHYEVTVPRAYNLDVRTQAGEIGIEDLDGQATLYSAGGNITAGRIRGTAKLETGAGRIAVQDVGGDLHASTGGGDVSAGRVQGEAVLRSAGGDISAASVEGRAQLETAGGNISLRRAGSSVTASTAGGRIDLGEATDGIKARTQGGGIRILRLAGPTQLETAGGSIYLASVEGAVKATTAAGGITAWLAGTWQGASQLETGSGRVVVYLPRELPVTIEASIESGEPRIAADPGLPLKILSDSRPDARGLRAEAAVHGGGDRLRLQVGSGSIQLRFRDANSADYEQMYKSLMQQMEERQRMLLERQFEQLEKHRKHFEEMQEKFSGIQQWELRLREKLAGSIPVDADAQKQRLIYQVKPVYPEVAKQERMEGIVWLQAQIDKEGKVAGLQVIRGNSVLARAALEAVRQWRYAPVYLGSDRVAVTTVIQVEFRLE